MWIIYIIGLFLLIGIINLAIQYVDNFKYKRLLGILGKRVDKINAQDYINKFDNLNKYCAENKILLKDHKGRNVNICSKCGLSMRIVHYRGSTFLGCSNYPKCHSSKNSDNIFNIKF